MFILYSLNKYLLSIHYDPNRIVGPAGNSGELEIIICPRKVINTERLTVTSAMKKTKGREHGMLL